MSKINITEREFDFFISNHPRRKEIFKKVIPCIPKWDEYILDGQIIGEFCGLSDKYYVYDGEYFEGKYGRKEPESFLEYISRNDQN